MVAGELYNASDPELVAACRKARQLCRAFSGTSPEQLEERGRMTRKLFAEGGQTVRIEPPFFCDYGFNIRLGESVYFNYNCVVLDVCEVRIGSFTMFGPAVQIYQWPDSRLGIRGILGGIPGFLARCRVIVIIDRPPRD